MAEYASPVEDKDVVEYANWAGLRNNVSPESFGLEDLVDASNIDINDSLRAHRRRGYSAPVTAAVDRSLWAAGSLCLGVGSNALKLVNQDWTTTTLRSGLTPSLDLSYASVADRAYWANGVESGCVDNGISRSWGLVVPGAPVLTVGGGSLRIGKYQVVVTYLREDGQESGAGRATIIELTSPGGIELTAIPVSADATVTYKAIYLTPTDGETLYRAGVIANATTTFAIRESGKGTVPLLTQFLSSPPAGEFVGYWKGWMLVAKLHRLYASNAYSPELFDLRKSYPFSGHITMLAPLDGVWVGTDSQVIFLEGESPETWKPRVAAEYGAVPGALSLFDGDLLGDGTASGDTTALFATTRGLCIGRADGKFENVTDRRFAYPIQERGAAIVRRHGGMVQMITTMRGIETAGNVAS